MEEMAPNFVRSTNIGNVPRKDLRQWRWEEREISFEQISKYAQMLIFSKSGNGGNFHPGASVLIGATYMIRPLFNKAHV